MSTRSAIGRFWIAYALLLTLLIVIVTLLLLPSTSNPETLLLPVFLDLLPLANAALDWVSLGFTRGLLYAIS